MPNQQVFDLSNKWFVFSNTSKSMELNPPNPPPLAPPPTGLTNQPRGSALHIILCRPRTKERRAPLASVNRQARVMGWLQVTKPQYFQHIPAITGQAWLSQEMLPLKELQKDGGNHGRLSKF
ncbi:hypothetical protein P7K49_012265 [Saguinus oedipus]|uniref:Uncharacterized protein n=1 Tax=Saguinus oedipus TaxID=9490 RepID=A0ABQ9VT15_SAGOE|nr:hypothetical protein P7K49_012265 [Saguinus oedipus]